MHPNYFICTLGQAATSSDESKPYRTISDFLSHQSKECGSKPAVGFFIPRHNNEWRHRILTFDDIEKGTQSFAHRLSTYYGSVGDKTQTIALLCHSSPEFLFTWLGLIRLGYSVLLLAPQCQSGAILHLCKSCNVSVLLYDTSHARRAREVENFQDTQGVNGPVGHLIPLYADEDIFQAIQIPPVSTLSRNHIDDKAIAYFHHTSGTSSGLPKLIRQTHRAAVGVLPHLPQTPSKATFTTTPLYHGGIADLFRAWTSDALIWLFPGKDVPITAQNITRCLDVAKSSSANGRCPEVKYFSSVPYVLQMMEADEQGLELLKMMDIVGVGGAALPAEVGDRLAKRGVNLISRFGSAECGFLMSSFRDFSEDDEWQYLRNNSAKKLAFEEREDHLSELVIKPGWPHMAKTNRDDGSFATADLFAKHPQIENAWLYHSRADSQLTLITGKKFDPAPLEAAIATSHHLDDVLIFGNGHPYPGVLLLRSKQSKDISDDELREAITPAVKRLNQESQDHARISRHMLIPLPHQIGRLEKSSKGTIIRRPAEARFKPYIDAAYQLGDGDWQGSVEDKDLPQYLIRLIRSMVASSVHLTEDADLFSYGVDSVACMQLRSRLTQLMPNYIRELPLSVVEDCGTVRGLSEYVLRKRNGAPDADMEDEKELMLDYVKEFSAFADQGSGSKSMANGHHEKSGSGEVVILTGATGSLGAHILNLLRKSNTVSSIHCLVRGADENSAKERVNKALEQRGLESLSSSNERNDKIKVLQAQLGDSHLGLPDTVYDYLAAKATLVLHIAWTVNFRLKLRSFAKDNLAGVKNLLELALAVPRRSPPRFAFCSSTAAIMNGHLNDSDCLPERLSQHPSSASPLGYSRSKWVAEQICAEADSHTALRGRIALVRVGQLSGDSKTGVWNTKEAWPMMLSTAKLTGCLPDLGDEPLDWLPVDIAAEAFVEAAQHYGDGDGETGELQVYHVLNSHQRPTWSDMLQWLKKTEGFDIVEPREWLQRLEKYEDSEHSTVKLLGLWKEAYGDNTKRAEEWRPQFDVTETVQRVPALKEVKPLDEEYVDKIWDWVQANVHL